MTQRRAKQIATSIAAHTLDGQMDCWDYSDDPEIKTESDVAKLRKAFQELAAELFARLPKSDMP